jgi:hypothetical protein
MSILRRFGVAQLQMMLSVDLKKAGLVKELFTLAATLRFEVKRCAASPNRRNALFLASQSKRRYLFMTES